METEARSRIDLARLMVARELFDNLPGELGARTAISRAYYGLFHSASALLLTTGEIIAGTKHDHGEISRRVRRRFGKAVGQTYENALRARHDADYKSTAVFDPISVGRQLKNIRTHVYWFCLEAEKALK